jgi:NADPH:quinone reductase-like Zn-dependent oxidoreductase
MPRKTMQAILAFGPDPASLMCERIPVPRPGAGEVLVAVHATAVTAGELTWPERWPVVPAHDVAGVVAQLGDGVDTLSVGDDVYGLIPFDLPGAAAEFVAVPSTALAAKPTAVDHLAAATLALGGLTARQALADHACLEEGQHVLVHGGAGGVGTYVVQLAAFHGATVTATASAADTGFLIGLGAHAVIDYATRFEEQIGDVDIVVDTVGGDVMARSWEVLRPGGILIGVADDPSAQDARADVRATYFVVEPRHEQLSELAHLVDLGVLRPTVGGVFPLAETASAIISQRDAHIRGKLAIRVVA